MFKVSCLFVHSNLVLIIVKERDRKWRLPKVTTKNIFSFVDLNEVYLIYSIIGIESDGHFYTCLGRILETWKSPDPPGGSSHYTKIFFKQIINKIQSLDTGFFLKIMIFLDFSSIFPRLLWWNIGGRPEETNSYSLTSWPELIVIIHGEYIPPGTHTVNLFQGHTTCTPARNKTDMSFLVYFRWTHWCILVWIAYENKLECIFTKNRSWPRQYTYLRLSWRKSSVIFCFPSLSVRHYPHISMSLSTHMNFLMDYGCSLVTPATMSPGGE
jgi:hypothetical protein